jgi:hypothetical protein
MILCYKKIRIFFGDKKHAIDKSKQLLLYRQRPWQSVTDLIQAEKLFGVSQSHGINGIQITKVSDQYRSILIDADFLITNQCGYALAVNTADCVPIVLYDSGSQAVALIHAGWKGIAAGVIPVALKKIRQIFNSNIQHIEIFIGPCARSCCYEVQADIYQLFKKIFPFCDDIIHYKKDKIFLDLIACIRYQCMQDGILIENMYQQFAFCTLCSERYCSYRREKNLLRNINAVVLY